MQKSDPRIAVLDGVRAYATLIIMGFHLWQQSWLQGIIPYNLLQPIGIQNISLTWIPRTGYMLVDILLLLSAFCLFLPYAQQMLSPTTHTPDHVWHFYKKRLVRILPPYYLCILFYAVFLVRPTDYSSTASYWQDLLSHLTFTHTFIPATYFNTHYPSTLWTLCIEMQFYLLFPLLARLFRRFPLQTWLCMNVLAELFIAFYVRTEDGGADAFTFNQLPAFFGVFANGMLGAYFCCFLRMHSHTISKTVLSRLGTGFSIISACALICMLKDSLNRSDAIQRWQVDYRFIFSALACIFILALDHAHADLQWLFSCKVIRFIAAISYNLYICHVPVMLRMKALRIPYYPDAPAGAYAWPQSASGESWHLEWQLRYVLFFWVISLLLSAALTYLFEEPVRKALMKVKLKRNH